MQLGKGGPLISFKVNRSKSHQTLVGRTLLGTLFRPLPTATQILRQYLGDSNPANAGQYTLYLRNALHQAVKKKSRKFLLLLGVVSIIAATALVLVGLQQRQISKLKDLGTKLFYNMKALELQIASLDAVPPFDNDQISADLRAMRSKYRQMQKQYDHFVNELGVYEALDEQDRLILRIARIFGECELNAPTGFTKEVQKYIRKWQSTSRLEKAVRMSMAYDYPKKIAKAFLDRQMPPQYYYLALQESDFDVTRCGPKTRYGIAKGMWQFMPGTARAYGLKLGPLREVRRPDPKDERHDHTKSTQAAVRFIQDLYRTTAQGSGLLVLASYNWGIGNVAALVRQMPPDPEERNFWKLVQNYDIPRQTHDFVFYVFAAAVIGENPELFGFDFENPLAEAT